MKSKGNLGHIKLICALALVASLISALVACAGASAPVATKPAEPQATGAAKSGSAAAEKELKKLRVAYTSVSASQSPVWITYEAGLFKKYGLDVELVLIEGGTKAIPAMVAGEVPIAVIAGSGIVAAAAEGADLVLVGGITNVLPYQLYVRPSILKPEDLKGQKLAVSKFGSSSDFATRFALRKMGLQPDKDVAIIQVGDQSQRVAAMQSNAVQGTLTEPPFNVMVEKAGMRKLLDLADLDQPYQHSAVATSRSFISKDREAVERFVTALVEGVHKAKSDAEFAKQVISKYTKSEDKEALDESYRYYTQKVLPKLPAPTSEGVAFLIEETAAANPKARSLTPDKLIDMSFVKKVEESELLDKLYK